MTAEKARRRVESFFNARVVPLKFISDRMREEMSERGFEEIAGKFIEQYGGYQAVNWIDPSWTIRLSVPAAVNEGALNQDLHQHPDPTVPPAIARAERDHVLTATAAIDLLQGGMGIALYLPVLDRDGALAGFVNGVFRVDALMQDSLPEAGLRERFDFALTDTRGREAYYHGDGSFPALRKDPVTVPLTVIDDTWVFTMAHSPRLEGVEHDSWADALTLFGIILSLVVAFAFRAILVREQKLRLSGERFRSITDDVMDNLQAGILITDARRRVVWINSSIKRYLGITRKEMMAGTSWT
ncbi:MAG: CHASE domain-containing protein [bacterium]|nr:CHASE domain-containing protein [bacterium]